MTQLPAEIFKAYDIRGIVDKSLTADVVRQIGSSRRFAEVHFKSAVGRTILEEIQRVRLDLEKTYPTLHFVGRNGTHGGHRQEHAMMSAMLTVENVLAGDRIHDVWNPAREEARWGEPAPGPARARHAA